MPNKTTAYFLIKKWRADLDGFQRKTPASVEEPGFGLLEGYYFLFLGFFLKYRAFYIPFCPSGRILWQTEQCQVFKTGQVAPIRKSPELCQGSSRRTKQGRENSIFQKARTCLGKSWTIIRYSRNLRNLGKVSMVNGLQTDQRVFTSNLPSLIEMVCLVFGS